MQMAASQDGTESLKKTAALDDLLIHTGLHMSEKYAFVMLGL